MGIPQGADEEPLLQLLRARLNDQHVDAASEPAFLRNAYSSYTDEEKPQAREWLALAESVLQGAVSASAKLEALNIYLQPKTVFVGTGTRITLADLGMFVAIRDSVAAVPEEEQERLPNLFRWFDYVQNKEDVHEVYQQVPIRKPTFCPPNLSLLDPGKAGKTTVPDGKENKQSPAQPEASPLEPPKKEEGQRKQADGVIAESPAQAKFPDQSKDKQAKEKKEKPPAQKKEVDCDVSVLDICVGQIKKVWKHPSADSLYVEEIDVGEAQPRQIVSGLVKYVTENEMLNRRVLVLLNIKPGKVRDVLSSGLVLCASNEDHSICEPVAPPDNVPVGERVKFLGHDGKPEEVLNPKKKQWEKIAPELRTDSSGVANYQGVPFQTSGGVCKSSIVNGSIK